MFNHDVSLTAHFAAPKKQIFISGGSYIRSTYFNNKTFCCWTISLTHLRAQNLIKMLYWSEQLAGCFSEKVTFSTIIFITWHVWQLHWSEYQSITGIQYFTLNYCCIYINSRNLTSIQLLTQHCRHRWPRAGCLRQANMTRQLLPMDRVNLTLLTCPRRLCTVYVHAGQDQMCLGFRKEPAGTPRASLSVR